MGSDDALALMRELVARPTITGGPNRDLVDDLASRLEALGAAVTIVPGPRPDALNIHAVLGPADVRGGLLLSAHTDVVDVAGQPWAGDPFTLRVEDGRALGRGAADMKGFVASVLAVLGELDPGALVRPLHVCLSCDEELGCKGVGPLLDRLVALGVAPELVLVGEPTELRVVDRHKGKSAARVHVRGAAAHSSVPSEGVNAVIYAARLVVALEGVANRLAAGPADAGYRVPHATVSVGPIRGGVAINIVPDSCTVEVEVRALPEQDPDALLGEIVAVADGLQEEMQAAHPDAGIEFEPLMAYPGLRPGANGALADQLQALTRSPGRAAADFGTEAGLYQQRLGVPVLVCGPGSMAQAHRADEYVTLEQLDRCRALLRALLAMLSV